jgi:hypothetical protein
MNLSAFLNILFAGNGGMSKPSTVLKCANVNLSDSATFRVFARFSPLIGGPSFLPIHAEIMLLDLKHDSGIFYPDGGKGSVDEDAYILHRIDFIPLKPTDPSTLSSLLSFQNVEGSVRHRKVRVRGEYEDKKDIPSSMQTLNEGLKQVSQQQVDALLSSSVSAKKCSIVVPLGLVRAKDTNDSSDSRIRTPKCIDEMIKQKSGMELNLLRNNCYSFAFDVLSSLEFNCEFL